MSLIALLCLAAAPALPALTTPACELTQHTSTIHATKNNDVIEMVKVDVSEGAVPSPGISVSGFTGVTIRNVEVLFGPGSAGIVFSAANGLTIVNASVSLAGAKTASGPLPSSIAVAITGSGSSDVQITNAKVAGASSGVYLVGCPRAGLAFIEARNMRGPFPRGQCVQFDKCNSSTLEDFSCENDNSSWTEDNINVYESNNVTLRRGLIDGNNSPSGDGVMYECGDRANAFMTSGLVEDVDAVNQGNGCFGGWGVAGLSFKNCRAAKTHCQGWAGRGKPSSGALVFAGGTEGGPHGEPSTGLRIVNGTYSELCAKNLVWPGTAFTETQLVEASFEPRAPLRLEFCWANGE